MKIIYQNKPNYQMFSSKIKMLPPRKGERYNSSIDTKYMNNKIIKFFGNIDLKDYVRKIVENKR